MSIESTASGILWRGRTWRVAGGAIDAPTDPASQRIEENLRAHFGSQVIEIERAAERRTQQLGALLRADGQPRYGDLEQREREAAIAAEFEAVASRVTTTATEAIEATRRDLTILDGATPFGFLTVAEQEAVATRRELLKEDCETRRPDQLAAMARAALASNDRANIFLLDRYLGARLERDGRPRDPALLAVARELNERLADPKEKAKRTAAERRLSAAQVLTGRVNFVRRGGQEGLRERLVASGRYGR
jgi:hypothetical protein